MTNMKCIVVIFTFHLLCHTSRVESLETSDAALNNEVPNKTATASSPCVVTDLENSDSNTSGLRISEKKCAEYVKQIRIISDQEKGEAYVSSDFPNMGYIGWKSSESWQFKCPCSLISPKFVLTEAICARVSHRETSISDPVPKIVRLVGGIFSKDEQRDYNIIRIIVHPQYKAPKRYNDIALMELETDVKFSLNVHPSCLWNSFDTKCLETEAITAGFENKKDQQDPILLSVGGLQIMEQEVCKNLTDNHRNRKWPEGLIETQICAYNLSEDDETHCKLGVPNNQASGGGPLQIRIPKTDSRMAMFYQIGVTSFGFTCKPKNKPVIYSRVSSYIDWIERIVWQS